jgi:hypothetical protein
MSAAWIDARAAYERATQVAAAIDSDKHEPAFDAAASEQGRAIEVLLDVPAPDLSGVAFKLQIMHREGYQHMLAPILVDVERLAGIAPAPEQSPTWNARLSRYRELRAICDAMSADDKASDQAVDAYCAALDELIATRAPDLPAALTKLDLTLERFEHDVIPGEHVASFRADLQAIADDDGGTHAVMFADRMAVSTMLNEGDYEGEEADRLYARLNKAEDFVLDVPSVTAGEARVQLRLAAAIWDEGMCMDRERSMQLMANIAKLLARES